MTERPGVLLAIHDWSTLSFGGHASKTDRVELTHAKDVGYDLATVLMVRGDDGAPIAPALVSLTTAEGVLSTRDDAPAADLCHIDQVREAMQLRRRPEVRHTLGSRDRPRGGFGQSLAAMERRRTPGAGPRRRSQGPLRRARNVVGCDRRSTPPGRRFQGRWHGAISRSVGAVVRRRDRGRPAPTGQTECRAARRSKSLGHHCHCVWSSPRSAISKGRVLARWLLLTNVPAALGDTATIARWYYFRWRIESLSQAPQGCRLAVGELAAARRPRAPDQTDAGAGGVRVDLGAGAAPRRRGGGLQEAADAIERPPDETES